jgi:hypothetical protein
MYNYEDKVDNMETIAESIGEELYPNIVLYRNLFKDIDKSFSTLVESTTSDDPALFNNWEPWSRFGEYLNPLSRQVDWHISPIKMDHIVLDSDIKRDQFSFMQELSNNVDLSIKDYISRYGLDVDMSETVIDNDGNTTTLWQKGHPAICKYNEGYEGKEELTMSYHSDYIREPIDSPGYKFAITILAYFNDNYEGGAIDFAIGKKLFKHKPKAGDILIFPSGNPDLLTEDGTVYLHSVDPITSGNSKYFLRMFIFKYSNGSEEWSEKEKEFGKEVWKSMQEEIMENFRQANLPRSSIEDGVRIK